MKKVLFICLILLSLFAFSCKKEEEEVYKVGTLEQEVKYDYTINARGYYLLDTVVNYKIQEVYAYAEDLDSFGIVQTYEEYQSFVSKIEYDNPYNYTESFFNDKSLIYIANKASIAVESNGYRYTPFSINSTNYIQGACFICLDYANEFFTSIYSIDSFTNASAKHKKSIQVFAFDDSEKVKFNLVMNQDPFYYFKDNYIFSSASLNITGVTPMYIYNVGSNSYCQLPSEYVKLDDTMQAYPYRNLIFKEDLTQSKLASMDGTLFETYEEYKAFKDIFSDVYFPFTFDENTFKKSSVYLIVNNDGGYLYRDKGNIFSTIKVESITNGEENVECVISKGDKFPYSNAIDIYMIRIPRETNKGITVTFK